jgi:hypothetical protein
MAGGHQVGVVVIEAPSMLQALPFGEVHRAQRQNDDGDTPGRDGQVIPYIRCEIGGTDI